jgi:hypothetical protein
MENQNSFTSDISYPKLDHKLIKQDEKQKTHKV